MRCENFNSAREVCSKGLPVAELYKDLICGSNPEKCPLVIGIVSMDTVTLN